MPKISVVIPTYNRSKELINCIYSLTNQTLKDIEIIIIDDGSTDNTESVINNIKDKRIKYIKRKNHGIGSSRNCGIELSTGDFISFIDSDDYVDSTFLEKMYKKAVSDNLDLVVCDYYNFYKNGNKECVTIPTFKNTNIKDNKELILTINYGPCNKLYKKTLIKNIRYKENIKYEDMPFVLECIKESKKIGKVNEPLNYFLMDNISETTTRDKKIFDIFKVLDIVKVIYNEEHYKDVVSSLIIKTLTNYTIQQRYQKDKNIRNKFIEEAFTYMKNFDINYNNNCYFKTRPILKRIIEKNKSLTKLYCNLYNLIH